MKADKTKLNVQRVTKQTHTPTHAVGIFKPLKGPVHGYHNMSVTHATMTLYRTIKIDHFHYRRNKKIRNRLMKKNKNLGCHRKQLYKPSLQFSAAYGTTFVSYLFKALKYYYDQELTSVCFSINQKYSCSTAYGKNFVGGAEHNLPE